MHFIDLFTTGMPFDTSGRKVIGLLLVALMKLPGEKKAGHMAPPFSASIALKGANRFDQ